MITVFTPTYNRKKELKNLYNSLKQQTYKDFEWIIVDDGSTDGTSEFIRKIVSNDTRIKYFIQKNGGKHTAFNNGIKKSTGEVFICVDSDDTLVKNALEFINETYIKYKNNKSICGFVFQKGYDTSTPLFRSYKSAEFIDNYNEYIINGEFYGDKCEVFITNILKNYSFPIFENEKFLAEGFLWSKIGRKYNYVFINKIIYLCEYREDGLTKAGRKLRINNPIGGMEHAKEYLDKDIYKFKIRIKNMLLYYTYFFFYRDKNKKNYELYFIKNELTWLCYPIAWIIYKYWKRKYY